MTRRRALRVVQDDAALLPRLPQLKAEHPCWGSRRIWAYLRCVEPQPVQKKRVLRRLRAHPLLVKPTLRLQAKRTPGQSTPKPTTPHEWWGLDMTKVLGEGLGWVSIVVVRDW